MFPTSATKAENVSRTRIIRRILCVLLVGCKSAWIAECVVKVLNNITLNFVTDCSGDSSHWWSVCLAIKNMITNEHLSIRMYFCSLCAFVVYLFQWVWCITLYCNMNDKKYRKTTSSNSAIYLPTVLEDCSLWKIGSFDFKILIPE